MILKVILIFLLNSPLVCVNIAVFFEIFFMYALAQIIFIAASVTLLQVVRLLIFLPFLFFL
jgi:hypothetical protein